MHGRPPHLPGSTVIRSSGFTECSLPCPCGARQRHAGSGGWASCVGRITTAWTTVSDLSVGQSIEESGDVGRHLWALRHPLPEPTDALRRYATADARLRPGHLAQPPWHRRGTAKVVLLGQSAVSAHLDTAPNEGWGECPHAPIRACFILWSGSTESRPTGFGGSVQM